jgi:hypothetical protein
MGKPTNLVTQHLIQTVLAQIQKYRTVVWFDPEGQYSSIVNTKNFPDIPIYSYDPSQGYLTLRRKLEDIWESFERPKILIYVPDAEQNTYHAMIEYTTAGVTLQSGQQPIECNTSLVAIARNALEGILPASKLAKLIAEVEKGQLNLAELDEIAGQHKDIQIGVLALIFKSENVEDICLQFLASKDYDTDIMEKNALPTLVSLIKNELDLQVGDIEHSEKMRESLARYLLLTEFTSKLDESIPPSLASFKKPQSKSAMGSVLNIVKEWRLRSDLTQSYLEAAKTIEKNIGLKKHTWKIDLLIQVETFPEIDEILQSLIEAALVSKPDPGLINIAVKRQKGFWPGNIPALKLRWQLIIEAGQVLTQAESISTNLKMEMPATQLVKNYAGSQLPHDEEFFPWCKVDTYFRRLERDEHKFDFEAEKHDSLQKLISAARLVYSRVIHDITEGFIWEYEKKSFYLPEIIQQTNIFYDFVQPHLENEKTAYILVDAFRYEMALDLFEQIKYDWESQIMPAMAVPPTLTEVGMAALMPTAERGLGLSPGGSGKLVAVISGNTLKNRADRVKFLKSTCPHSIVLNLNQIAPLKDKKVITALEKADLAVVTAADEIDGLWESEPEIARRLHDDVFNQLRRCIRNLFNVDFKSIIITSDHGFIAGDNLMAGMPMDPPGGETIDLHRRVWIGRGGANIQTCLRKPLSAFGIAGDLDLVTPEGLGCFKTPGGSNQYYHGGLSLQENVIPILIIQPGQNYVAFAKEPSFNWKINLGSKQISTRFFSVTIEGSATELIGKPPKIRVELKSDDQVFSTAISASYGFDDTTKEIKMTTGEGTTILESNEVVLLLHDLLPEIKSLDIDLINSDTGLSLAKVKDIPITIAF